MRPASPPGEWGRRLSDRLRARLDAGDLPAARRLALEGDGAARSLEKEYALMVRGLGLTIRILLDLLGETHEPSPAGDGVAGALRRTAARLAEVERAFAEEQARLAAAVVDAMADGDAARARAGLDRKERDRYLPLHDRLIRFMAEVFGHVLRARGPAALLGFHRATAERQRAGFEAWERLDPAAFAQATAFLLKQHMGTVEVSEEDERFTIVQRPCGSGGRLRAAGAYQGAGALPFVETPGALTAGQARFPVYCSHCPIWNGVAPTEWFGAPQWVFEGPARPDGSCTLHIYKDRRRVPAAAFAALGLPTPPPAP